MKTKKPILSKPHEEEIILPTGTIKVGFKSVASISPSTSKSGTIVKEFKEAAETDLFSTPANN